MRLQTINLPWPPTVNTYWRKWKNRMVMSKKGRAYRINVKARVLTGKRFPVLKGRLQVRIDVFPPDRRKRDLDNLPKGILDGLQHAGVYEDDSQIDDLRIVRNPIEKGGRVHVEITELEEPTNG